MLDARTDADSAPVTVRVPVKGPWGNSGMGRVGAAAVGGMLFCGGALPWGAGAPRERCAHARARTRHDFIVAALRFDGNLGQNIAGYSLDINQRYKSPGCRFACTGGRWDLFP